MQVLNVLTFFTVQRLGVSLLSLFFSFIVYQGVAPRDTYAELVDENQAPLQSDNGHSNTDLSEHEALKLWLNKLDKAQTQLHYTGEMLFQTQPGQRRIVVSQALIEGQPFLRLSQESGSAQIIRRGDELVCVHADASVEALKRVAFSEGQRFAHLVERLEILKEFYTFTLHNNGDKVAGRDTIRIDIKAQDVFRHHHRLWLDEQTALLLKAWVKDHSGSVLEQFEFVRFNPDVQLTEQDFAFEQDFVRSREALVKHLSELNDNPDQSSADLKDSYWHWELAWLPPGFLHSRQSLRKTRNPQQRAVPSIMYSDGLSSFSLFLEHSDSTLDQGVRSRNFSRLPSVRQGAILTHSRIVNMSNNEENMVPSRLTFVGDVPFAVADRVLQAFRANRSEP